MTVLLGTLWSSIKQIEAPYGVGLGKRNFSGQNAAESGFISQGGESLIGFLELEQEPGIYSRDTAGMSIRNSSLFIEVRNLFGMRDNSGM